MGNENKKGRKKKEIGYNSVFATRLRDLMEQNNTTQPQLAEAVGVSRQAVGQWKDGNTVPDILDFQKIANYYNVSADYLLGRAKNKSVNEDIQVAYRVTGLTADTITKMRNNIYEVFCLTDETDLINSEEYKIALETVNELLQNNNFWYWVLDLVDLKETSEDGFLHIKNINSKEIMQAGLILDIEPIILFEYISNSFDETEEVNYEERCDMLKYRAFCASQRLLDDFDWHDVRKSFNKKEWLEYLKINKETLLDLRKQSEEFRKAAQQKAGD